MGIQGKDNLLTFAKTAAKAASAFELPADQLCRKHGQDSQSLQDPIGNIEQLGDVINYPMTAPNPRAATSSTCCSAWAASPTNSILKGRRARSTF